MSNNLHGFIFFHMTLIGVFSNILPSVFLLCKLFVFTNHMVRILNSFCNLDALFEFYIYIQLPTVSI